MNDILIRIGIALTSGGTYIMTAFPDGLTMDTIGTVAFKLWVGLFMALLTGAYSPSTVKKTIGMKPQEQK